MDANAMALLQQLASNPQMVSQLQSVLSAVGSSGGGATGARPAATHPSSSSSQETFASSSSASSPAVTLNPGGGGGALRGAANLATTSRHAWQQQQQQQQHPPSHHQTTGRPSSQMPTVSLQKYEQLERLLQETDEERKAQSRVAAAAEQRAREMEKELQRLTQRVEQLSGLVAEQRQQYKDLEDQHQLATEEMKQRYEAVLRRKDEVHEESLRQVLKARQLYTVAKKFEDSVKARGGGLVDGTVAMNVRNNNADSRSGVATDGKWKSVGKVSQGTTMEEEEKKRSHDYMHNQAPWEQKRTGVVMGSGVKRERSASLDDARRVPLAPSSSSFSSHRYHPQTNGTSPAIATPSPRPLTTRMATAASATTGGGVGHSSTYGSTWKKSTTLLGTSGASSRKRRTPRTPSLTNADRLTNSRSPPPPPPMPMAVPMPTATTTASVSVKLATPTPVASAVKGPRGVAAYGGDKNPYGGPSASAEGETSDGEGLVASETLTPVGTHIRHPPQDQQQHQQQQQQQRFLSQYNANIKGRVGPGGVATAGHPHQPQQRALPPLPPRVPSTASGASSAVGGPTRSPSPLNPKRGPMLPRRFIFTGLKDPEPEKLAAAIEDIGEDAMVLQGDLDEPPPFSTTHIVVRGTPRSVKALCGVVSGKWLVPPEYVFNSQQAGFWLDEYEEGGLRLFPPPLKCQRFLLTMDHRGIREKLTEVIEFGGGEVVNKSGEGKAGSAARQQWTEQGVIVITSGDDLLRYATQTQA